MSSGGDEEEEAVAISIYLENLFVYSALSEIFTITNNITINII